MRSRPQPEGNFKACLRRLRRFPALARGEPARFSVRRPEFGAWSVSGGSRAGLPRGITPPEKTSLGIFRAVAVG